jgi:hypothetical protein
MADAVQAEWKRDTAWRQGRVFDAATVAALGLYHSTEPEATCVVVISHDCDLANDSLTTEPEVEVIIGRTVAAPSGNYSWGKAPRTLHFPMLRAGAAVTVELIATSKKPVPKATLAAFQPSEDFVLEPKGLAVLRSWLSSRYSRAAFPDMFAERMKSTKLDVKLAKTLEPHGDLISFVYFDIDSGQLIERKTGQPYELSIVLVFPSGEDPDGTADRADDLAETVTKACEERLVDKDGKRSEDIVLKTCFAVSEEDLPVSKARVLLHWRLEHLSLKADDGQPGPPKA